MRVTEKRPFAVSLLANTEPAEPPPIIMKAEYSVGVFFVSEPPVTSIALRAQCGIIIADIN